MRDLKVNPTKSPGNTDLALPKSDLLIPILADRALHIFSEHRLDYLPFENQTITIRAWFHVGMDRRLDLKALKGKYQATDVQFTDAWTEQGEGLFGLARRKFYDLMFCNPKDLPSRLKLSSDNEVCMCRMEALNAGNIPFLLIDSENFVAVVNPEYHDELNRLGYSCYESHRPSKVRYSSGPLHNVTITRRGSYS